MDNIVKRLRAYMDKHPFVPGDSDCETVLDQLYQAYAESHESDPPEIRDGFKENVLPLFRDKAQFLVSGLDGASAAVLGASAVGWEIK